MLLLVYQLQYNSCEKVLVILFSRCCLKGKCGDTDEGHNGTEVETLLKECRDMFTKWHDEKIRSAETIHGQVRYFRD